MVALQKKIVVTRYNKLFSFCSSTCWIVFISELQMILVWRCVQV